jgi:phosphatidylinositol alpha-1,6-mannosyltransferase
MLSRLERGEDYKGHREVIAAWRGVRAQIPGAELWVAGDGNLRGELEMLTRECGVADAVRFLGRVSETQKQELLAACRCFVMPSRGEGFGLVYLEAMRAGRPCLVGDNDGGREPVNPPEAGLEVNPSDPAQVERNLVQLLRGGDEWSAWSSQARARYEAQFTAAHFERRLTTAVAELW